MNDFEMPDPGETTHFERNGHIVFVTVDHDPDAPNPCEDWDGVGKIYSFGRHHNNHAEYDPMLFYSFQCPLCGETLEFDTWNDELYCPNEDCKWEPDGDHPEAIATPTDAVALSYFEHGLCRWGVSGTMDDMPDFGWDGVGIAGYWEPDKYLLQELTDAGLDAPDRINERRARLNKWATEDCSVYTDWCNGSVYGYSVQAFEKSDRLWDDLQDYERYGTQVGGDGCLGFYGWDDLEEQVEEAVKRVVESLKESVLS